MLEIMEYLETGALPMEERKARELVFPRQQYVLLEGVLDFVVKDQTLRIIPPGGDRRQLFEEVHSGVFGGHLRDAKIHGELSRRYWWPGMCMQ
jgi:hypothetical protein